MIVTAWWYRWLTAQHPERADDVMRGLERRADVLVGLDARGEFSLKFPPPALEPLANVMVLSGIYRDRDLYNYVVGSEYPGANWTEKLRPRPARYRDADLDKLRLSVPAFVLGFPGVRRRIRAGETGGEPVARGGLRRGRQLGRAPGDAALTRALGLAGDHGRALDAHCLMGLTHVQRIEIMRLLEGLSGTHGIVGGGHPRISGTRFGSAVELPPDVRDELLLASARPYSHEPLSRLRFLLDMRRHRVAVAPVGHGEVTDRHGAVLSTGAALVCQDLSHVEMMLPLEDRVNAAFCRPDLSDLRPTVEELLRDDDLRRRIGQAGRRSYMTWAAGWRTHLENGIEAHIREALGLGKPRRQSDRNMTYASS